MIAVEAEEQSQLQLVEREKIKDEEDLFEAIDKLTAHEINAGDMTKLQDAGIYTCNGLMMRTKKFDWNQRICEAVEKIVNFGYMTGSDALLKRKLVVRITTGSQALNELLGGGIETSAITEAFGEFRSGKTQLAHTLCVSTQLPINMKRGNGKVAYIDTDGTFRPDRIIPIAERFGMDPGAVLENIIYARAYTYEHQYNLLLGLAAKMAEEPFRLLIVDSVIALFRVDFTGRGELPERQQKLAQMLSRLMKIAEEFNVAVYMTNQVIAGPGGGSVSGENCSRAPLKVLFDAGSSEETTSSTRSDARWLGSVAQSRIGDQGLNQENEHGQEEGEGVGAHEVEYLVREGDFRGLDVQIPIYLMTGDQQMDWVTDISRRECLEVEDFEELAVVVAEKVRRAANPSVPPFFLPKYQSFI